MIVSYIGYKILLGKPDTGELIFKLQSDALNLKDVTLQVVSSTMLRSISKIDLDLNPVRNTQELLRIVPGLFIAQHAGVVKQNRYFFGALTAIMELI